MMMEATMEKLELAFEQGTHASRQDYITITKNMESVCFEGPDRTKRMLGSFPGSVRVSVPSLMCVCVCAFAGKLLLFLFDMKGAPPKVYNPNEIYANTLKISRAHVKLKHDEQKHALYRNAPVTELPAVIIM